MVILPYFQDCFLISLVKKQKGESPPPLSPVVCISGSNKCSFFWKIWRALFSCYLHEIRLFVLLLTICVFFLRHWRFKEQQGKRGDHVYLSLSLPRIWGYWRIYTYIFTVMLLRFLPHVFDHSACNYQTITQRDLSTSGI